MKKWMVLLLLGSLLLPSLTSAIDLKQSKFTQIVNSVEVISAADQSLHTAMVNDIFSMPDLLRTGPNARAELAAADGTITRVGANTVFSFDPANRSIDLKQGSLLFHSPKGKGGGTIHTGSATASVIGTTIIVTATPNGGFKLLDLEGQAEIRFLNGLKRTLEPGQMTFILPDGGTSPIIVFRLDSETQGSLLVSGFDTPLDSQSKIDAEITQQLLQILNGAAADTGLLVGNNATPETVQIFLDIQNLKNLKNNSTPPPTPPVQFQTDGSIIGSDHVVGDTLSVNYSPLDPKHLINTTTPFTLPSSITPDIFPFSSSQGFIAKNIDIDTASIDLSSFTGDFDFLASGNMKIWQSLDFGEVQPDSISLVAGGSLSIAQGAVVYANNSLFWVGAGSFNTMNSADGSVLYSHTLDSVEIGNDLGELDIASGSDLTVQDESYFWAETVMGIGVNGNFTLNGSSELDSYGYDVNGIGVYISSTGDISANDSYVYAYAGGISLVAGGDIVLNDNGIYADDDTGSGDLIISAGGSVLDYYNDLESYGGNVNITAGASVDIDDDYIYGYNDVTIQSAGALTVEDGAEIEAYNGDLNLISTRGDINITTDASVYTDLYGSLNILAAGNIDVDSAYIETDDYDYGGGDLNIAAKGGVTIADDSEINDYSGDLNISAGINPFSNLPSSSPASVDIENSSLYAYNSINISATGDITMSGNDIYAAYYYGNGGLGDLNITAGGSVTDTGSYLEAYAGGNVNITATGYVDLEGYGSYGLSSFNVLSEGGGEIYADGVASVTSLDSDVYIYGYSIYANGSDDNGNGINIVAANGSVDVENAYSIYSYYGGVNISAGNEVDINNSDIYADYYGGYGGLYISADNVYIYDSDITAGYDSEGAYDINITSLGCGVDIDSSYLYASGNVSIEAYNTLTLEDSSEIESYGISGVSLKSDHSDVDVYDSSIYAYNGGISITADNGSVDLKDSYLYIGEGSSSYVYISASGNVYVSDTTFDVYNGSDTSVNAGGNIDLYYVGGSGDGTITLTAGGYINAYDYGFDVGNLNATAGTYVTLAGQQYADVYDSTITANGGDVDITGQSAGVDIYNTTITASGDIYLTAGNNNYGDFVVTPNNLSPSFITLDVFTPETFTAPTPVSALVDYVDVEGDGGTYNGVSGVLDFEANIDAYIYYSSLYTYDNNILVNSLGTMEIDSSYIEAGDSVYLVAAGNVTFADTLYNNSIYADNGDVDVQSTAGSVSMDGTYIYANGKVIIDSFGTLTVGLNAGNTYIEAYGDVSLTSDTSDVNVYTYTVESDYANVYISAAGNVLLSGDSIYSGYDNSYGGDVNIQALSGTVDLENTYVSSQGNINVYSYDTLTLDNNSELDANGYIVLSSVTGDVDINTTYGLYAYGSDYYGNGITITAGGIANIGEYEGSETTYIYAYYGSVVIDAIGYVDIANSDIEAGKSYDSYYGDVIVTSGDTVDIYNSYIYAVGGVDVESANALSVEYSEIYSDGSSGISLMSDNSSVSASDSSFYAYYGNVEIYAGGLDGVGTVNLYGDYINAYGEVNITSEGDLNIGSSDSSDTVIYAGSGIYLTSYSGNIYMYGSSINGGFDGDINDLTVESGSSLYSHLDEDLTAYGADISFHALLGSVDIEYTTIDSGGSINISDSSITAGYDAGGSGSVNIYSYGYLYVGGISDTLNTVTIEGNNISISGSTTPTTITANNGDVNIINEAYISTADATGFNVENSHITYGNIDISGGSTITANNGNVYIETASEGSFNPSYVDEVSSISLGDIDISDSTITANGGSVIISAGGYLTIGTSITLSSEPSAVVNSFIPSYADTIYADNDVCLFGYSGASLNSVSVSAGGKLDLTSYYDLRAYDSSLTADNGNVNIYAYYGYADVEYTTISSTAGSVDIEAGYYDGSGSENLTAYYDNITAGDTVTFGAPGTVTLTGDTITGAGTLNLNAVNVNAGSDIEVSGTSITADNAVGVINLTSATGQINVENGSSLSAAYLNINTSGGILLDGTSGGTITGSSMTLNAGIVDDGNGGPTIAVNGVDLSSFTSVAMSAYTINLTDVNFGSGSIVNLNSGLGALAANPNTGAASVPGYVNFITGVTYGGQPAQNYIGSGITIGTAH